MASDVDGDTLVWSMETNVSWLTLNPGTGTLQGTPSGVGSFWALVTVNDGNGGTDNVNLTIMILPDLDGIPNPEDMDVDEDGVPDTSDAFPTDQAASIDTDGDGYPDEWNEGKSESDSTSGLKLDYYPDDPEKWEEEKMETEDDEGGDDGFIPGFELMVVMVAFGFILILSRKRNVL
jgi:hypothetical protein